MNLNIAICDDDKVICDQIEHVLLEYKSQMSISLNIDIFYEGQSLINYIDKEHNNYDLIYLDIAMDDINGVDVGIKIRNELKDHKIQIVYISGKTEYDRQLFDVQPLLFIPKPIENEKLINSIDLAIEKLSLSPKLFHYKKRKEYFNVLISEIMYFENAGRHVTVKLVDGQDTFVANIKDIALKLMSHGFIQVNQSVIVNYQFISKYSREEIILLNNEIIAIPKNKRTKVKEQFLREINKY